MNQQNMLENGDDASPKPKGGSKVKVRRALKYLWYRIRVSCLMIASQLKKERKINGDVGCTRFLDGGQTTTTQYCHRPWQNLPKDLLFSIASRLDRVECIRFMSVCKGWLHSIKPKPTTHEDQRNHLKPCLLVMENSRLGWLSLYTPIPSKTYKLRIPELKRTDFRYSRDGWIMVSKMDSWDSSLFLLNMLTGAKFDLPDLIIPYLFSAGVCFTSTPGSSDFMVVVIEAFLGRVAISTYRPSLKEGQVEEWTRECYENNYSLMDLCFTAVACNPIFYKGKLYCLDNYGHLGIYDPVGKTWRIASDRPDYFLMYPEWDPPEYNWIPMFDNCTVHPSFSNFPYESFMVDLEGDLISLFVNKRKPEEIYIFRLDCCKMSWEKVNSLSSTGELFVGLSTSISTVQVPYGSWNKLYFPGFNDQTSDYEAYSYSLKTKTYDDSNWRNFSKILWRPRFTWIDLPILSKWESSIIYSKWKRM